MRNMMAFNQTFALFKDTYQHLKSSSNDPDTLNKEKMNWANIILNRFNVKLETQGEVVQDPSTLFVGNHISYMDIPLLLSTVHGVSFVAKHEISKWPVFGKGARKLDTVFVKRSKDSSRKDAVKTIKETLSQGKRIALFPSGTTSIDNSKSWRKGIFEIACSTNNWIQPFRLSYTPLREVAYIDRDFLPTHVYKLVGTKEITAKIEFHEPVKIKDPIKDCLTWQQWAQRATN